ncbi:uncharacterized protein LOC106011666, partial [Aplysia californica]|uniref:Uncharacterized protein LOC106011666 n=1 Tax=Aplysia californica TaxID=6500 RepID=A0ABM0ZZ70_APLCA
MIGGALTSTAIFFLLCVSSPRVRVSLTEWRQRTQRGHREVSTDSVDNYIKGKYRVASTCREPVPPSFDLPPDPTRTRFNCSSSFLEPTDDQTRHSVREQIHIWCDDVTGQPRDETETVSFLAPLQSFHGNDSVDCLHRYIKARCYDNRHVPNVVHLINYGSEELVFRNAIGLYSVLTILKPCLVLLHGDVIPRGLNWFTVLPRATRMVFVPRTPLTRINGRAIKHIQSSADITRIDVLLEYGGIYLDSDMVILKPIDIFR